MTKLYQYSIGDRLPALLKSDGTWVHPTVLDIVARDSGYHVVHEYGSAAYGHRGEEVTFPTRLDEKGNRVNANWCLTLDFPTPEQMAVGDVLPPHDCAFDPRNDADWKEMDDDERVGALQMFWEFTRDNHPWQSVLSITMGDFHNIAVIHTEQYAYDTTIGEPFKMPWKARVALPKRKAPPLDRYPRSGTYRHQATGKEAQFAIHHAGKGRYPLFIPAYNAVGEGFMLPPQRKDFRKQRGVTSPYAQEWGWWELLGGGKRHPFDPRGLTGAARRSDGKAPGDFYDDPAL